MKKLNYISQLVHQAKQGNMLSMKTLYEYFAKEMLTASYRITQNITDSEDILQEAFLVSFEKLDSLKEPHNYGAWLKKIVINKSLRIATNRMNFSEVDELEEIPDDENEDWFRAVPFEKIRAEIQSLPDGCRQIFTLFLLENYKHREIAEMLNISISNSKSQYRYALKILRSRLGKEVFRR